MRELLGVMLLAYGLCGMLTAAEPADWLVQNPRNPVECREVAERNELVLNNGMVRRTFRLRPNFATV